jgi:SAM-dependent methyltransferase
VRGMSETSRSWRSRVAEQLLLRRQPSWYRGDLERYRAMGAGEELELRPMVNDRTPSNPYDSHYFFQDVWAARRVAELRPAEHIDVGSRVDLVGFLTAITEVVFVDIRTLDVGIEGLSSIKGSILELPFEDRSVGSISSLHVAEHIGLGRYGDPLDPNGSIDAATELQRVVAPGGQLLFSLPVGRARTCFNAHRVHDPTRVAAMFPELELIEFAGVDDSGRFARNREPAELVGANYACGMYRLRRAPD